MIFNQKIKEVVHKGIGLCVGLDPVIEKMPNKFHTAHKPLLEFNLDIIEATLDFAVAYKPNLAFYEVYGAEGWIQLEETIKAIPKNKLIIADGKRGDIGNTAKSYAQALFKRLEADAATVNPYLGYDSLEPFIEDAEKGIFILAVTSNPGGADIQNLESNGKPIFLYVIDLAIRLNQNRNVGLVVGATKPEALSTVLHKASDLPLLIPGIGEQGGEIRILKSILKGYNTPVLVNVSRSVIYASRSTDYKEATKIAAEKLTAQLYE